MARKEPSCCRCGTTSEDIYWGPAEGYDRDYSLCAQCMHTILSWWIVEHYAQLERFAEEREVRQ